MIESRQADRYGRLLYETIIILARIASNEGLSIVVLDLYIIIEQSTE
jgi:hypothetical protein